MRNTPVHEALGLRFDRLSPAASAALAISLGALWLLGRRYAGFTHDASIYVLQRLRVLDPKSFAEDLFFVHGSQDAYTVFPQIYALLIGAFGAENAAMVITVAGQMAFFAAAAVVVSRICARPVRWWSLALLATVSGYYGGVGVPSRRALRDGPHPGRTPGACGARLHSRVAALRGDRRACRTFALRGGCCPTGRVSCGA